MVLSLLGYFFSMVTAFTVLVSLWIGIIGASPFAKVRVQPYPLPAAETAADSAEATPATAARNEEDALAAVRADAEKNRLVKEARDRKRASLARQYDERDNTAALGYASAPWNSAASPPAFSPPALSPEYSPLAERGAIH
jgi:hypothetical protein